MAQSFIYPTATNPEAYNVNSAENFLKGFNAIYQPMQMKNQLQTDALNKALLQTQAQYAPEEEKAKLALLKAQTQQATQSATPSGEYYGLLQYYNSLPPGKEKDMTKQRLDMLTSRGAGTTVYGENGQPLVQIGGGGPQSGAVQPGKLSTGEMPYYKTDEKGNPVLDATGQPIQEGVMRPLSEKELTENRGREIFNTLYPDLNKKASYYFGKGSWSRFLKDVNNADKDPEARQHIVDYLTVQKTLPAVIAKEQQTLGASNTLGQFNALKKTMDSSDIAKGLKTYAGFKLPSDVMDEAGKNLVQLLNTATEKSYKIPGYEKVPFNAINATKNESSPSNSTEKSDSYSTSYASYHPKDKIKFDDGTIMTAEEAKKKGLLS